MIRNPRSQSAEKSRKGISIRVLVADDTRIHTQLLADSLGCDPILEVFTPSSHFTEIIKAAKNSKIDVAVVNPRLGGETFEGLEAVRQMRSSCPGLRAVVLLDSTKRELILESFRAGATGLFSRDGSLETLSQCVHKIHAGEIWATSEQLAMALEALVSAPTVRGMSASNLSVLSKRELEVVASLGEGLSNREIALRLGLSQHTVKNYLFKVFDKLGVSSRIELLSLTLGLSTACDPVHGLGIRDAEQGATAAAVQKSAEDGNPVSQIAMAKAYSEGQGVQKDLSTAYMWYLRCERNILETKEAITGEKRQLAAMLTTEEILAAQKLAAEHDKKPAHSVLRTLPAKQSTVV